MFGYGPGELLNKNYQVLIPERARAEQVSKHEIYLENPLQSQMGKDLSMLGIRKDKSEFPVAISLNHVKTKDKTLYNCMIHDLTEIKKLEDDRRAILEKEKLLREEAVKANRIKDEFLATLSHELRTPLTTILGWTQVLLAKELNDETKEALAIIERSSVLQGQLINDLLDVSRIQSGKLPLDLHLLDLKKELQVAVESVQKLAEKKSIELKLTVVNEDCYVSADPCRLQQILWNLLANAVKFTPRNGNIFVDLSIIENDKGRYAQTKITDTGIGIKPNFLEKIFERFSQADSSFTRAHGGLGLGLSIVRSLVELQLGTVAAESPGEGKGSTFTIRLPLVLSPVKIIDDKLKVDSKKNKAARLDGAKILVVDDCADNRLLFSVILKSVGAVVESAESVVQACIS